MTAQTSSRPVAPAVVLEAPRVVSAVGWTVASHASPGGHVQVSVLTDAVLVRVGDDGTGSALHTDLALYPDGSAQVQASAAPPALLVSTRTARTVPAVPGMPDDVTVTPGDRLLVLSADALEALPSSLVSVLQALPSQVSGRDPADLLLDLFAELPNGSGVIVVRDHP